MNRKRILSASAAALMLLGMLSACSTETGGTGGEGGGGGGTQGTTTTTSGVPSTMAPEQQEQTEEIKTKDFELENKSITFLASWPRNPANGKNKDVALELFQTRYGGEIIDHTVADDMRFDELAKLVSTGQSPDFFSVGDMDSFPKCVFNKTFMPLDDYIDFNDEWWSSKKAMTDQFVFGDKHYVGAVGAEIEVLLIYNKAVVGANGLPDPADLLKKGEWNWNTCLEMMRTFCDKGDENYATDGWWVASGFSGTTGVPYIGMKDGKVVNNLRDSLLEAAQDLLYTIRKEEMAYPVWDYGWTSNPGNVGLGKTLFYPCGMWALTEVGAEYSLDKYGDVKDVGFVPMPKCPYVDDYYIPARVTGYALVSGAPNPEGVACYLYCEAAAVGNEKSEQITHDQYINEYGWTEDMWEMRVTIYDMVEEHPCFDFYKGITARLFDSLDNPVKDAYHNAASWTTTRENIYDRVQYEVDEANKNIV